MKDFDPSLYLVLGQNDILSGVPLQECVRAAVQGGVSMVQLREKKCSTREFIEKAGSLKKMLALYNIPLIINDRLDVALAVGADGLHIGQNDIPYKTARRLLGPDAIIGLSIETFEDAEEAKDFDVDYLGVSPVFATATKFDIKEPWGLEGLKMLREQTNQRLIGIGGINARNCHEVMMAGADGVAVVSAICYAKNPCFAAQELKKIVTSSYNYDYQACR